MIDEIVTVVVLCCEGENFTYRQKIKNKYKIHKKTFDRQ